MSQSTEKHENSRDPHFCHLSSQELLHDCQPGRQLLLLQGLCQLLLPEDSGGHEDAVRDRLSPGLVLLVHHLNGLSHEVVNGVYSLEKPSHQVRSLCTDLICHGGLQIRGAGEAVPARKSFVPSPCPPGHLLAQYLAMAMDWPIVAPSTSSTGSWPSGRELFRAGHDSRSILKSV